MIPFPFTRGYMLVGSRIYVPPGLDREQLEPYRLQVQAAMDALTAEADSRAGLDTTARWATLPMRAKAKKKDAAPQRRAA